MKFNSFETHFVIEIGKQIIDVIRKEMGFDLEDWKYYLEQVEMDNKGFGINGKVK